MQALSDFLLDSGFQDPFSQFQELNGEHTMENLREALRQLMESGDFLDEDAQQKYEDMSDEGREQMLSDLMQRMQDENYINGQQQHPGQYDDGKVDHANGQGQIDQPAPPQGDARFQVTDKSMDFLGYKTLRDLLGGMGRAVSGRHDTRFEASGCRVLRLKQGLRIRRCDEPRRERDPVERDGARGTHAAAECRL